MLRAGGDVGRDLAAVDWAATPLGPPEGWPKSLQTVVQVMLGSRFAMWMAWGPELTFLCNDAYRRDTLGAKYPWALGRPAREVWAEIWPDIGPRIETVMRTGSATWDASLLLFLERSGYVEETYHTFSYSPLADDDGATAGMLCVVSEDTERVIAERRMRILRDLGSALATGGSEADVLDAVGASLRGDLRSLPFALVYLGDPDIPDALRLAAGSGIARGHAAAPAVLPLGAGGPWPAAAAMEGGMVVVEDLDARFARLPSGAWPAPPEKALVVPLRPRGEDEAIGVLVAALNRHRPDDDGYRDFVALLADQIAAALAGARAYAAERRRAEQLAELDAAKTQFFTNVSHELRTPLTLLLGPAEDALADDRHALDDVQRERLEVIARNGRRLHTLVNTLLDFSRLESGSVAADVEAVDLGRLTAEIASMFESAVARAGLEFEVDCPPLPHPVAVDREMWAKIVLNLLSNALKHTFAGGISVHVEAAGGEARLRVADTGVGIAPADQARLFDRFQRVEGARSRTHEGTGIGLALVTELAALHGGSVDVESTPGEGSVFTVRIPLAPGEAADGRAAGDGAVVERLADSHVAEADRWAAAATEALVPAPGRTDGPRRPRVLIADDNADMRRYVGGLLGAHYDVEAAADGEAALARATAEPPDLVLTDVMMPRLDGFGLLEALRSNPATADVPVVMLSARAGEEGVVEGLEAGADDYLAKPFSARELLARVRANLELDRVRRTTEELTRSRRRLDQAQRLAGVGSWELDLDTNRVWGSEEFCRQLAATPDQLASRAPEISDRVHPDDRERVRAALEAALAGAPLDYHVRIVTPDGVERTYRTIGEVVRDGDGRAVRVRGSNQDITEQLRAEAALAAAAAEREAAAREHRIADELQRSLLPATRFALDHLDVAAFYRAGGRETQVGGDWYDVIPLGAGRTALVIGDVMGRGVRAAAVMGQVRAAVRAYARLDLPPADVLEYLDGVVRDMGEDHIVTCAYAVYDPGDRSIAYAVAGHPPPIHAVPGRDPAPLDTIAGPPLGTGPFSLAEGRAVLEPGTTVVLYTDGLVERRDRGIDVGIDELAGLLRGADEEVTSLPTALVNALVPAGHDDDVAVLVARVAALAPGTATATHALRAEPQAIGEARGFVATTLDAWDVPAPVRDDAVLLTSELTTNALIHGKPPIFLRLRRTLDDLVLEVHDCAISLPRRVKAGVDDEHGRGLQLVSSLADRWGTRPIPEGKAVWCTLRLAPGRT